MEDLGLLLACELNTVGIVDHETRGSEAGSRDGLAVFAVADGREGNGTGYAPGYGAAVATPGYGHCRG